MTDTTTALTSLQQAMVSAANTGPFLIDAAFLTAGLNDADVIVPDNYDTILGCAFQTSADVFSVSCDAAAVGEVSDNQFSIDSALITFIDENTSDTPATLVFSTQTDDSGVTLLNVQITSSPLDWSWGNSFPYMANWPFNQLVLSATSFDFSSASGAIQNLQTTLVWPDLAQPFLALFEGLTLASPSLSFCGALDMSHYGGPDFSTGSLLPSGTISALLSSSDYTFASYLTVSEPRLTLIIPAPTDGSRQMQSATLALSAYLHVEGASDLSYQIQVLLFPSSSSAVSYSVVLSAAADGTALSPAAAIALMAGKGSYFEQTPSFLQQFLASFGLTGMTLSGTLGSSVSVTEITLQLSTPEGVSANWQPLPVPTPYFDFTVESFYLNWVVYTPFSSPTFNYLFGTTFTILPSVFKSSDGSDSGLFTVEFTSDEIFSARFDGSASLSDFLNGVSNNAVILPSTIGFDATVANINLELDCSSRSFSFYSDIDIEVNFFSFNETPILSLTNASISLSALSASSSSDTAGAGTVWSGEFSGLLNIDALSANCSISFDGENWELSASLTESLNINNLITQFFPLDTSYSFPDFLPGTLTLNTLDLLANIPTDADSKTSYDVSTSFDWSFSFGDQTVEISDANLAVDYDGNDFSGSASGLWSYTSIGLELGFAYSFEASGSKILSVSWEGFVATWRSEENSVSFTLTGWTLGSLIQTLVATLGDPYFTLPSPWNLLDKISLDGLVFTVSLEDIPNRVTCSYTLASSLNLGFIVINGITLTRNTKGQVIMVIDGEIPPSLEDTLGALVDPDKGEDVTNMPSVPGQGSEYFKLFLLALGQRISINGYEDFNSTEQVIKALANVPATEGSDNPVNPASIEKGQPCYNANSNWLIAAHFGMMKTGDEWAVDFQLVFNDPNLYGMRLALNGGKTGAMSGFVIDILYKKITDDIGLFDIEFTFPDSIRNLNFGAVSVVLPSIGIQIYTNGDFRIDLGFPVNLDFSKSFSLSAIVFGIPVLGSGGLYFGKLSNATATQVPVTSLGTFNPVVVFGLGLQVGLGYNFVKGPLKAGFALTVAGIIEGVIATYHPYSGDNSGTEVQDSNYFRLQGTVGLIGMLYGTVDFKIISASVLVNLTFSVQIVYESFQPIPISATASVKVSVKVRINLGLFKVTIKLSFHTVVTATFTIDSLSSGTPPWYESQDRLSANTSVGARRSYSHRSRSLPIEISRKARRLLQRKAQPKRVLVTETKPTLTLVCAPQFTVLAAQDASQYGQQEGAFVTLFAMDAPDPTAEGNASGDTSFDALCQAFFPWLINLLHDEIGDSVDLHAYAATSVTRSELQSDLDWLGDNDNTAFTSASLLQFLADGFTINIVKASDDLSSATLFPLFDGLVLTVPAADGSDESTTITLETYATATDAYRVEVSKMLQQVAASMSTGDNDSDTNTLAASDSTVQSMASFVFVDVFSVIGRGLLQAGIDAFDNYAYAVQSTDSIAGILEYFNNLGNSIIADDVSIPNAEYPLTASLTLTIPELSYVIQTGDTLSVIAQRYSDTAGDSRWQTTQAALIKGNANTDIETGTETGTAASGGNRILQTGITFTLSLESGEVKYTTLAGDTFGSIAVALGISLDQLAAQTVLFTLEGLLLPTMVMDIPAITYTTGSSDTLNSIATTFAITVSALFAITDDTLSVQNIAVDGLFATTSDAPGHLAIAYLEQLPITQIYDAIQTTEDVGQIAGQVARFVTYGLRLPAADGLSLSSEFLYPSCQSEYALYQLTGQQFPTPTSYTDYSINLGLASSSNGVDLSFIQFDGGANTSLDVPLADAFTQLGIVLAYAQTGSFIPAPNYSTQPLVALKSKQFSIASYSTWSTSDNAALLDVTNPTSSGVDATPYLWSLPTGLVALLQARQTTLESIFSQDSQISQSDYEQTLSLMPSFAPMKGSTSPNKPQTSFTKLTNYAFATRVDFQITLLQSSATSYQLIGPSSANAQLLEFLLTGIATYGDSLISGLFLLYNAGGSDDVTLTGQADTDFLSFITQTNLSTESNPPAIAMAMAMTQSATTVNGIANSPSQFIKLLWELSVVQSGGYYLYWEDLVSGGGLPSSIFDASGSATLTLVVTLPRTITTLPNFINAFVSTEAIDPQNDVMVVQSLVAKGETTALTDSETLTKIALSYGVGVGQLAAANSDLSFNSNSLIPIKGILHQLSEQDCVDPTQTLNHLATYYSLGAQTPITEQQISDYNPSVTIAIGASLLIPSLVYCVDPNITNGPGNTFNALATYYGLTIEAIAVDAASVATLFAIGAMLTINTQMQDSQATQDPGNLSFILERENLGMPELLPDSPTQQEKDDFAAASLYSLYNTLSAGLGGNPFFGASAYGLPFGPQDNQEEDDTAQTSDLNASNQARKAMLATIAEEDYEYTQVLGYTGTDADGQYFAQINPAPATPVSGLPAASANPYIGVGSYACVALRWQDLFGNTTITPFEQPPAGYLGALNQQPLALLYTDRLIGLASWPKIQATYLYSGEKGQPALDMSLRLDGDAYADLNLINQDLARFQQVYFQLNQNYTDLNIPGVTGNAVSMTLSNSLLLNPTQQFDQTQSQAVRDFVADCVIFLQNLLDGISSSAPFTQLSMSVDIDALNADNLIPLDLSLTLTRQSMLVEPLISGLPDGLSVTSKILPQSDAGGDASSSYTIFANQLETCLQINDWAMKAGAGLSQASNSNGQSVQQLFAVRFGNSLDQGIYFNIADQAGYYAPLPIATSLESDTVNINLYPDNLSHSFSFSGIDQNLWFESCLNGIDKFLSATYAPAAYILDLQNGITDPLQDGELGKILLAKQNLADAISKTVSPILSSSASDTSTIAAAQSCMKQQLLNTLAPAFGAGAAVVFGLDQVSGADGDNPAGPPSLYGQPAQTSSNDDSTVSGNQNYTLSTARIPLSSANSNAPRLAFNFVSKNVESQAYVPLEMEYQISHLEFELSTVPGIENYIESQWLSFINGPFTVKLGEGTSYIPVINRALPTPPTANDQIATASVGAVSDSDIVTPSELLQWDYSFSYNYSQAAQDTININITLNKDTSLYSLAAVEETDLFNSLANFITNYPVISADLDTYLVQINGQSVDQSTYEKATQAVAAFQSLVTQVSDSYIKKFTKSSMPAEYKASVDVTLPIVFDALLDSDSDGNAVYSLHNVTLDGIVASYDSTNNTISNGSVALAAPVMEILSDQYQATPLNPPPSNSLLAYCYIANDGSQLTLEQALAVSERNVALSGLNVMVYKNALSSLLALRNKFLVPDSQIGSVQTMDSFLFQTPVVQFTDPILPRLSWAQYPLRNVCPVDEDNVTAYMAGFFNALFQGAGGTLKLSMTGGYEYSLVSSMASLPRTYLPLNMLSPILINIDPDTPPAAAMALTQQLESWYNTNQPTTGGDAAITFKFTLFSNINSEQILFSIDDLYWSVTTEIE
jgi:hypothetical protein